MGTEKKRKKKEKASIKKYKKFNTHTHKQIKRMANKFVAVFLMCIVVVAAFSLQEAKAAELDKLRDASPTAAKDAWAKAMVTPSVKRSVIMTVVKKSLLKNLTSIYPEQMNGSTKSYSKE